MPHGLTRTELSAGYRLLGLNEGICNHPPEHAARVRAMGPGQALPDAQATVIARTGRQFRDTSLYHRPPDYDLHFNVLKRMLDRRNPGYES